MDPKIYLQEIKQLELDLVDMQSEVNRLRSYNANFTKEEKMMRQMLKANEVRIRSMEKENQQMKNKLKRVDAENNKLKSCVVQLAEEIQAKGGEKEQVMRVIGEVSELVCLDEVMGNAESLDTEEQLRMSIEGSRKEGKADGDAGESRSGDSVSSPKLQETSNKKQMLSSIQKEKEKSQYKMKLEEEIEKNIQSRSRVKEIKEQRKSIQSRRRLAVPAKEAELNSKRAHQDELGKGDPHKEKLYLKCRITDARIFNEEEKAQIDLMIRNMKSFESFCLWLWGCFEQKCLKQVAEYKQLETEKSGA